MKIQIEYKDKAGKTFIIDKSITKLGLLKNLATAGMGQGNSKEKLFSFIGTLFKYDGFFNPKDLKANRFSSISDNLYDPTEKAHFSNLAGKAIAHFLSKEIDNSIFTTNYEAEMKLSKIPISGSRPDLVAYSETEKFAIEAKGYSGSYGDMKKHKEQSKEGGIKVNFSVASVSYNLYKEVKCKYHDPVQDNFDYDPKTLTDLSSEYYLVFKELIEMNLSKDLVNFQNDTFFAINLLEFVGKYISNDSKMIQEAKKQNLFLLVPLDIYNLSEGINIDFRTFIQDASIETIFVDRDFIGVAKESKIKSLLRKNEAN